MSNLSMSDTTDLENIYHLYSRRYVEYVSNGNAECVEAIQCKEALRAITNELVKRKQENFPLTQLGAEADIKGEEIRFR